MYIYILYVIYIYIMMIRILIIPLFHVVIHVDSCWSWANYICYLHLHCCILCFSRFTPRAPRLSGEIALGAEHFTHGLETPRGTHSGNTSKSARWFQPIPKVAPELVNQHREWWKTSMVSHPENKWSTFMLCFPYPRGNIPEGNQIKSSHFLDWNRPWLTV